MIHGHAMAVHVWMWVETSYESSLRTRPAYLGPNNDSQAVESKKASALLPHDNCFAEQIATPCRMGSRRVHTAVRCVHSSVMQMCALFCHACRWGTY